MVLSEAAGLVVLLVVVLPREVVGDWRVNECDSSSWKWRVGRVSPFMRLIPIEPSGIKFSVESQVSIC